MESSSWHFERVLSSKLQGYVWVVSAANEKKGYFKFATADQWHYSGPLVANEFIASNLATYLGYPVGELEAAAVLGPDGTLQHGVVSIVAPAQEVTTWNKVPEEVVQDPGQHIHNLPLLSTLLVFDAWIVNIDRASGKNIVLYRDHETDKYKWYLIDHALTLFGAPSKWEKNPRNARYWGQIWKFYHVPKGFLKLQSKKSLLDPMIERIGKLPDDAINEAVAQVPIDSLADSERQFTRRLLLHRKKRLRKMVEDWLKFHGTKEFRL